MGKVKFTEKELADMLMREPRQTHPVGPTGVLESHGNGNKIWEKRPSSPEDCDHNNADYTSISGEPIYRYVREATCPDCKCTWIEKYRPDGTWYMHSSGYHKLKE